MNKTIAGAIILFLLVVIGAVGVKFLLPVLQESEQRETSDAAHTKGKITVAFDNWVGYFPLRSPQMKSLMRQAGYQWICQDDNADYAGRMKKLDEEEIDFAVATVDSYILNGAAVDYPGVIIMVIDESKGGDAILANKDKVASLDAIKGKSGIRVAYTPQSPSHHLAKAAADHFAAEELLPKSNLALEANGSQDAREMLAKGKADVAICWEPDVSLALKDKNIVKILGTEDTQRLIVDILIANRRFAKKNPELVNLVLDNYFKTLKHYRDNPHDLEKEVRKETGLSAKEVESMLKGVEWVGLNQNGEKWFGISKSGGYADEGLVETMESTIMILQNSGDFARNPIPDQDPYRLTNSSFLEDLLSSEASGFLAPKAGVTGPANSIEADFSPLDKRGWNKLTEVGTLKVEPVVFSSGANDLDMLAKQEVDQMVQRLKHYPHFRVVIKGHTGTRGDAKENQRLSQGRADAVARYLEVVYNVDPDRLRAVGLGGTQPLPKKSGESMRAYRYRLPRVELVLVREDY